MKKKMFPFVMFVTTGFALKSLSKGLVEVSLNFKINKTKDLDNPKMKLIYFELQFQLKKKI